MCIKDEEKVVSFADRAFAAFNEIMANNQRDTIKDINRPNKGELFVLHFLAMQERQVLPSELSAALQASTARISALLGSLEKKGQIRRDIDKTNRRNILVTITEAGRERAQSEMQEMRSRMTRVFVEMGEKDTEEFIRLTRLFFDISQKYMLCRQGKNDI